MAQAERPERSRGQWILLGMLVVLVVIGGSFFGLYLQTTVINPPTQAIGVCPPPAYVSGWDCVQKVCTTSPQNQQTCSIQEAGYILGGNGVSRCTSSVCVGVP